MIEEGLFTFLTQDTAVAAMIGGAQVRIWPLMIPQHAQGDPDKQPCLVYQRIGRGAGSTFCATDDLVNGDFQIDSYALNYLTARRLAAAVRVRLVDYVGLMGTISVDKVTLDTEADLLDPTPGLFRVTQSYSIWYRE